MGVCVKAAWLEGIGQQKPAQQQEQPRENKAEDETVKRRIPTPGGKCSPDPSTQYRWTVSRDSRMHERHP
jgi:hypothetical protein